MLILLMLIFLIHREPLLVAYHRYCLISVVVQPFLGGIDLLECFLRTLCVVNISRIFCVSLYCWPIIDIYSEMKMQPYSPFLLSQIFAFVVTLCYGFSMFMGFKRWRK